MCSVGIERLDRLTLTVECAEDGAIRLKGVDQPNAHPAVAIAFAPARSLASVLTPEATAGFVELLRWRTAGALYLPRGRVAVSGLTLSGCSLRSRPSASGELATLGFRQVLGDLSAIFLEPLDRLDPRTDLADASVPPRLGAREAAGSARPGGKTTPLSLYERLLVEYFRRERWDPQVQRGLAAAPSPAFKA